MAVLVVPGVSVEARFDVLPPAPAASGVVGVAAIVDHPPVPRSLVGVTKAAEVADVLGPGTLVSAPEITHALGNGAAEVVVAPVVGGGPATAALTNQQSNPAVRLQTRSNGKWGNTLAVDVRTVNASDGSPVRATIRILRAGRVVEEFADLVVEPGSALDLYEVLNTRSAFVVALDPSFGDSAPAPSTYSLDDEDGAAVPIEGGTETLFTLLPKRGVDPEGLTVRIDVPSKNRIRVRAFRNGALLEDFTDLTMNPDARANLPSVLLRDSAVVHLRQAHSLTGAERLPAATIGPVPFTGGTSPNVAAYQEALDLLAGDPRINLVLAAIEPTAEDADVQAIHQALAAHAVTQSDAGAPRIAFGAVTADEEADLDAIRDHSAAVRGRRFVLVSPPGATGAVVGAIARLSPEVSPTFKPVPLFGVPPAAYRESQLNRLLGPTHNVAVVQQRTGRGVILLRGLDTSGDQISVTRVADAAIREVKAISENFIGILNTADARAALREQIIATFTRMERAGQLVPSTDGADPAFLVDVYSTQLDFAQGIVRIDIAVRPVRSIDYIYATIRVKN
ncbi:MAG: hypothetical protein MUF35_00800 [Candidatus Nanopelagicales bacterium]|jgi:hypothetical protein|nr:hypothetical protein [Candidatus Nanopelagicales bacterium]